MKTINCNGRLLDFKDSKVMGILNLTPDSFYDGGKYSNDYSIQKRIDELIEQQADIIDIGACSTRPGAKMINFDEEMQRLKPALEYILKKYPESIVSVDTFRAGIASVVVNDYGVAMINDISAGEMDTRMFEVMAGLQVPYIIMHMKGIPENMQQNPTYHNIVEEIIRYFSEKIAQLRKLGVIDILVDPGFGFGKTVEHNFQLLNGLNELSIFETPLMVGLSRKSMIYKTLDCDPDEALNGTSVLHAFALEKGANILRVHDVIEAKQVIKLYNTMLLHSSI